MGRLLRSETSTGVTGSNNGWKEDIRENGREKSRIGEKEKIDDLAREIKKEEQSDEYKRLTEDKDKYEQLGRDIEELKKS